METTYRMPGNTYLLVSRGLSICTLLAKVPHQTQPSLPHLKVRLIDDNQLKVQFCLYYVGRHRDGCSMLLLLLGGAPMTVLV